MAILPRSYTGGRYALDLEGDFAGWIKSAEGGHCKAEVVSEKVATDIVVKKHIAGIKYEDISLTVGTSMSKSFFEWINASVSHQSKRIGTGAIITADFDTNEVSRLNFFDSLITEIGLPALDSSSKDAASLSVKFSPERTRTVMSKGGKINGPLGTGHQKKWSPANFRFRVDGMEDASKWISKIDALTIKQKVVENPLGEMREVYKECAHIEYPNLVITMAENAAADFYKWHEDFVINGNCTEDKEKTAVLEYLTPNLQETILTVNFQNVGIFALTPDKLESGGESIKKVKIEMYCEQLKLTAGNALFS